MPVFWGYSTFIVFSPPPSDQCWIEYMANASVCIRGLQHCVRGAGKLLFWKIRQCFYQKNSIFAFVPNELSQIVWEHLKIEKSNFCYYKRFKTCKMDWLQLLIIVIVAIRLSVVELAYVKKANATEDFLRKSAFRLKIS